MVAADSGKMFVPEVIVDEKSTAGEVSHVQVKWVGYPESEKTWERTSTFPVTAFATLWSDWNQKKAKSPVLSTVGKRFCSYRVMISLDGRRSVLTSRLIISGTETRKRKKPGDDVSKADAREQDPSGDTNEHKAKARGPPAGGKCLDWKRSALMYSDPFLTACLARNVRHGELGAQKEKETGR